MEECLWVWRRRCGLGQVLVLKARNLLKADSDGLADPFVVIKLGQITTKTAVKKKYAPPLDFSSEFRQYQAMTGIRERCRTLEPTWDEAFLIEYQPSEQHLKLTLFDWDASGETKEMGNVLIDIKTLRGAFHTAN